MIDRAASDRVGMIEKSKRVFKERRSIVKLRGYQPLCASCRHSCKVYGAPNSTFKCFMREPEE